MTDETQTQTPPNTDQDDPPAPAPVPAPPPEPPPEPPSDAVATPAPQTAPEDPLRAALKTAADALRALAIATETDIVPDLISGDTPDEVRASIERSRAAYRAALAHIARSLPTPPPPAPPSDDAGDPLTLISRGLRRKE